MNHFATIIGDLETPRDAPDLQQEILFQKSRMYNHKNAIKTRNFNFMTLKTDP